MKSVTLAFYNELILYKTLKKYLFVITSVIALFLCSSNVFAQVDKAYFFNQGRQNLIESKYTQAIDNFNTLIKADTTLAEAYYYRGVAKYNLNDYIGALSDFNEAIVKNPVYTLAYYYRAITFSQLGRYDDGLKSFDNALDIRPDFLGIYFARGVTYLYMQQAQKAVDDFSRYIRFEPQASEAYVRRGVAYLMQKDTIKALTDYNKAIAINAFNADAFTYRARLYLLQEEYNKAVEDLDKAIRLDPDNSFNYFNRAIARKEINDYNGALTDFGKVLESDPDNALTYFNLALIYSEIKDYNKALANYAKVIEINPSNVLVYYNRAAVLAELRNYRSAIEDYTKAINLYPDFANAYLYRSYIKTELGMLNDAKKDYDIAQLKIAQYKNDSTFSIYADTSRRFNRLFAFDSDFSKKAFDNSVIQDRKVDIVLKPLFKFTVMADNLPQIPLDKQFFDKQLDAFRAKHQLKGINITSNEKELTYNEIARYDSLADGIIASNPDNSLVYYYKGITQGLLKQYSNSINYYTKAIELDKKNPYYYINRSSIQAEMIEFISSIENNMPVMALDGSTSVRNREQRNTRTYNYDAAINDLNTAEKLSPNLTYLYYNRGNLKCLSNKMPEAIEDYTKAIKLYPYFGEAYFNRGLVQIYLRDTEKGCLDISKSGELGMEEAYSIIKKYCLKDKSE